MRSRSSLLKVVVLVSLVAILVSPLGSALAASPTHPADDQSRDKLEKQVVGYFIE